MYACFGLIHLLHTESMWSETPRHWSQCGVRLPINWVGADWNSMSTESTQKAPTFTKISLFCIDSVDNGVSLRVDSFWHGVSLGIKLSWQEMRLRVNWVKAECLNIWISRLINERIWKHYKSLIIWLTVYMFDQCKKTEHKIPWKCTFKSLKLVIHLTLEGPWKKKISAVHH